MAKKETALSKETFCTALRMIKEQEEINDQVADALKKVSDCSIFGCDNKWLAALEIVLKEAVNDQYDYIGWWLYEASDDYIVWTKDGKKEWRLNEPESLYDFIITECQN